MDVRLVQDPLRPPKEATADSALDALGRDIAARLERTAIRAAEIAEEDQRAWQRLVDVLTVRHEEALEVFYEASGAQPAEAWSRVRGYHAKTVRSLWPEVMGSFERFAAPGPSGRAWTEAVEALEAFSETLPVRVDAWLDPAIYAPGIDEGTYVSARKLGTRFRLWSRDIAARAGNEWRKVAGKDELPLPGITRPVPVREIVQYHASVRLAGEVERHVTESERVRRRRANALVAACARWNRAVLEAEYQLTQVRPGASELDERQVIAWRDARHAARRLQEEMEALALIEAAEPPDSRMQPRIAEALRDDLEQGGTYLLPDRRITRKNRASTRLMAAAQETTERLERLDGRLKLERLEFEMREAVLTHRRRLLERMEQLSVTPVTKTFDAMRRQIDQALETLEDAPDVPEALMDALDRLRGQLARRLQSALSSLPGIATAGIAAALPDGIDERQTQAARLADRMVVAGDPDDSGDPGTGRARPVDLRTHAARAFNDSVNERLRRDAELFRTELLGLWNDAEQATQIITYNLNTAQEELARRIGGASGDAPIKSLAADGLVRASETIGQLLERIPPLWLEYESSVMAVTQADWLLFFRDINADVSPRSRVVGMRTRLGRHAEDLIRRGRVHEERERKRLAQYGRLARARLGALVRRGRSVVGALPTAEQDITAALDAVTGVEAVVEELPFVYRRLFSFEAVTDPVFLEGRAADLTRVDQHYDRWRLGRTASPLTLTFAAGEGRTSFLNVIESRLRDRGVRVGRAATEDRITDETALVELLRSALEIESDAASLADLVRALHTNRSAQKVALIVDHLECLMLQVAGGMSLLERFFRFVARTDGLVFYVLGVSPAAWQLIGKSSNGPTTLVTSHMPTPFGPSELETIVMNRHRRSGLRLVFEMPPSPSPMLRQRLRRAGSEDERQQRLREDYFDRLYRASGGSIRLAILHWIRSLRIDADVRVRPLAPLDLSFLYSVSLGSAFSLRAILTHRTLSVEEHAAIFRTTDEEAMAQLEALLDRRLIEPADGRTELLFVQPDVRYRVVPLLQHPVQASLRSRNML